MFPTKSGTAKSTSCLQITPSVMSVTVLLGIFFPQRMDWGRLTAPAVPL